MNEATTIAPPAAPLGIDSREQVEARRRIAQAAHQAGGLMFNQP
ncbi:MAG: hypothetical protein ABWY64_20180 [Tardiphaga sp.]